MILSYFDENKFSEDRPLFYIGGLMVPDTKITEVEDTLAIIVRNFFGTALLTRENEIHGKELWHGKGAFKRRTAKDRLGLLKDLLSVVTAHRLPVRLVCVDVPSHRERFDYPEPEYALGLMLLLERFCIELERVDDIGLVFGDHEEDEYARAISDFSSFKGAGRTPMYRGRSLEPLKTPFTTPAPITAVSSNWPIWWCSWPSVLKPHRRGRKNGWMRKAGMLGRH